MFLLSWLPLAISSIRGRRGNRSPELLEIDIAEGERRIKQRQEELRRELEEEGELEER
jgi:hypothetical protein